MRRVKLSGGQIPQPEVRPTTTPAYQRIADDLRTAIISGQLAPGSRLKPAATLASEYGVVPTTVRQATTLLLAEGLLDSKPGAGLYVRARPSVTRMVRSWYQRPGTGSPWRAEMAAAGRDGDWRFATEFVPAPPAIAERLRIEPTADTVRTAYTFTLDGTPTYLSVSWEPLELTRGTPVMMPESGPYAGAGVRDRMAAIGHAPTRVEEVVRPHTLTAAQAQELGLHPGIACIAVERTYYEGAMPLETADIVLPPHYRAVYEIPLG